MKKAPLNVFLPTVYLEQKTTEDAYFAENIGMI